MSKDCPACGHWQIKTVDTRIEGRGSMQTLAIKECTECGALWGEERTFHGVIDDE